MQMINKRNMDTFFFPIITLSFILTTRTISLHLVLQAEQFPNLCFSNRTNSLFYFYQGSQFL
jgi:hypothetical protein